MRPLEAAVRSEVAAAQQQGTWRGELAINSAWALDHASFGIGQDDEIFELLAELDELLDEIWGYPHGTMAQLAGRPGKPVNPSPRRPHLRLIRGEG